MGQQLRPHLPAHFLIRNRASQATRAIEKLMDREIIKHEAYRLANILLTDEGEKRPEWIEIPIVA